MIDLHIHTTYSDGTDSTIKVLEKAEKLKLEAISITDHNSIGAYHDLANLDIGAYFSGKIINGIEFKTRYEEQEIEVLGYGLDISKMKRSRFLDNSARSTIEEEILAKLKVIGKNISLKFDDSIHIDKVNIFASSIFGKEIFKHSENQHIIKKYNLGVNGNDFYKSAQTNQNSIFYIDNIKNVPLLDSIINEIHDAKGLAFLAHPCLYPFKDVFNSVEEIVNNSSLDGLECFYPLFDSAQTKKLLELSRKYNLYVSGGSDYHGKNKPDIQLGIGKGNLNISKKDIGDWVDEL